MFEPDAKFKSSKLVDLIILSLRVFKVSPFRTAMTILGIGVSFAMIFFLLSLGYGLQHVLLNQISSDTALVTIDVSTSNAAALPLTEEVAQKIKALPGVKKINPIILTSGQIEMSDILTDTAVESVPKDVMKDLSLKMLIGSLSNDGGNEVAISRTLNSLLAPNGENIIGQSVSVTSYVTVYKDGLEQVVAIPHPETYIIKAIFDADQNIVFVPFEKVAGLNLPYGLIKVLTKDTENLVEVRAAIIALGFTTSALADTVAQANQIFGIFQIILALFGLAALVVAIIGMINTMTISLLERLHEIGIMKIFGITKGDVEKLFMLESSIVGFLGGISGLTMGYIFSKIFNFIIGFLAKALGGKPVDLFFYPLWFIVSIIVFSTVVGFLVGISPARQASKLDPLKALKFK